MKRKFRVLFLLLAVGFTLYLQSCKVYHSIAYWQNVPDSIAKTLVTTVPYAPILLQSGDVLSISVVTSDPTANLVFSQLANAAGAMASASNSGYATPGSGGNAGAAALQSSGTSFYTIDKNGLIEIPQLGSIKAINLTTDSVKTIVLNNAKKFYLDPVVQVKLANFKVNILGEVQRPGTYTLSNEKNTLLDALAIAGDLTVYAKRNNVSLIRDSAGTSIVYRIDLTKKEIFNEPYFYLRQNDVVYVETGKEKIAVLDADETRKVTIATTITASVLTLLIFIVSRF